jgi:hypothetical protein
MAAIAHFHFREHWRDIKRGRPGRRFQERYERARRNERKTGAAQRIFFLVAGLVALAIGGLLAVFPGPAIPFFFLAGALLATESRILAKGMDWAEVRLRKLGAWGKKRWQRLPQPARVVLVILGAGCSAASAYFSFRLMRD